MQKATFFFFYMMIFKTAIKNVYKAFVTTENILTI